MNKKHARPSKDVLNWFLTLRNASTYAFQPDIATLYLQNKATGQVGEWKLLKAERVDQGRFPELWTEKSRCVRCTAERAGKSCDLQRLGTANGQEPEKNHATGQSELNSRNHEN